MESISHKATSEIERIVGEPQGGKARSVYCIARSSIKIRTEDSYLFHARLGVSRSASVNVLQSSFSVQKISSLSLPVLYFLFALLLFFHFFLTTVIQNV